MSNTHRNIKICGSLAAIAILTVALLAARFGGTSSASTTGSVQSEPTVVFEGAGRWEYAGGGIFNDVFFLDENHGWVVGDTMWRTTDGGLTWTRTPLFGVDQLARVAFGSEHVGWTVEATGGVLRSQDGGATWDQTTAGHPYLSARNRELSAVSASDVWLASFTAGCYMGSCRSNPAVYRSTDGGLTWELRLHYDPTDFRDMDFFDAQHGWVTFRDEQADFTTTLALTTDGGETWTFVRAGSWGEATRAKFDEISFGSATHGWLVGTYGFDTAQQVWPWHLLRSTDGGLTWSPQYTVNTNSANSPFGWLQAMDANRAWAGQGSRVLRTTNGGATWEILSDAGPARAHFLNNTLAWGVTGDTVYRSTDGGQTWSPVFTLPTEQPDWYIDHLVGWRIAGGAIERTTDGGSSWQTAQTGLQQIDDFQFVDEMNGWAWNNTTLQLAHTTDGGRSWEVRIIDGASLSKVQFVDHAYGWVRTNSDTLQRTADGGSNWSAMSPPATPTPHVGPVWYFYLTEVSFADRQRGWASGEIRWGGSGGWQSAFYQARTDDGGSTWSPWRAAGNRMLYLNRDQGWAWEGYFRGKTGYADYPWDLARTSDGGVTWTTLAEGVAFPPSGELYPKGPIAALDPEQVWLPGMGPGVGHSTDSGQSWEGQRVETGETGSVSFDALSRGFASPGPLLRYRNTEIAARHALRPPTIDGDISDWYDVYFYSLKAENAWRVERSRPVPLDSSAVLQAAWDENNLYFAVRLYDDVIMSDSGVEPWKDDAVELAFDGLHDHIRDFSLGDDRQFTITATGAVFESGSPTSCARAAVGRWARGYHIEVAIPRACFATFPVTPAGIVGFNWSVVDDDDGGAADSRLLWLGQGTYSTDAEWGQARFSMLSHPFEVQELTPTPTATTSATPTLTPTATATPSVTSAPTSTATEVPSATPTPISTATPTATPTPTATATPTATPTSTATATPTATPTPPCCGVFGHVWFDSDGDGRRAGTEFGLVGVQIRLVKAGVTIAQATTDSTGYYGFPWVAAGEYVVREVHPTWVRFSSTSDAVPVTLVVGSVAVVDFGDWDGLPTWLPLVLR